MLRYWLACVALLATSWANAAQQSCSDQGVCLQVLGSGGPEMSDRRASSAYLIWLDGHARVLVDMGGGSMLRFEQSGARLEDLDIILLTHLHVDHSADLPTLLKASFFSKRSRDLAVYGPSGNHLMPDTVTFIQRLFSTQGAYRYLQDYLDGTEAFRLLAYDIKSSGKHRQSILKTADYQVDAVPVHHGPVPAIAYRVTVRDQVIVFSGDMNNDNDTLTGLAANADLLVAHHAIPEQAGGVARKLHMPPSVIGRIAAQAGVSYLLLSHRMNRTLGLEQESSRFIRQNYKGPLEYAEDLQCLPLR